MRWRISDSEITDDDNDDENDDDADDDNDRCHTWASQCGTTWNLVVVVVVVVTYPR